MTTYIIKPGYPSTSSKKEIWFAIVCIVNMLCEEKNHNLILEEVVKENDGIDLLEYVNKYILPCDDMTIRINQEKDIEKCAIIQTASGGGEERENKEIVRRAFCRCIINMLPDMNINMEII